MECPSTQFDATASPGAEALPQEPGHGSNVYSLETSRIGRLAENVHIAAAVTTLPAMSLIICLEVVMRYIFNSGLSWSQEACGLCLFVLVFVCQAHCWQKDRHIRMDVIYNLAPAGFKRFSNILTVLTGGIFYSAILIQAVRDLPYQFMICESTAEMHVPMYLLNFMMIGSCGLLLILLLGFLYRNLAGGGN